VIPIHLKLSGFLSYREPAEVDFTRFHLACISGTNGAGKSSLLDAMTWALFGQARKRDDSVINLQSQTAEVAFTFAYEGSTYRVLRSLKRGKTTVVEFQIAEQGEGAASNTGQDLTWRPLTERTGRDTQKRIEDILRLDYETFINVSFFLQGRADQFAQQPPARRKEILGSILGLEVWEGYRQRTADRRKRIEREVDGLDARLKEIADELAEEPQRRETLKNKEAELKRVSTARKTQERAVEALRKAAVSQAAAEKARLEEERRSLKGQEKTVNDQAATKGELTKQMEKMQKLLKESEGRIQRKSELVNERNAKREEQAALKAENEHLKAVMDELKERIERLEAAEGATCPLCGQALSEQHRQSTLKQLKDEGKEKGDRYRANKTKQDELIKEIAAQEAEINGLESAERERLSFSNAVTKMNGQIESIQIARQDWESTGAKRLEELEALLASEKYAVKGEKPAVGLEESERALLEFQEQENRLNQEVGAARQRVGVLDDLKARQKNLRAEREERGVEVGRHQVLERAFGKDGIPTLLIEQALPEIEAKANELLDRLSDGSMSVRFVTQSSYKDKKREDLKETLDIQLSDGAGVRDYEMYSGGEAFRANFAIRLALSEVLASRTGARLQLLVIDEGFGSQDEQGRQRLIQSIHAVQDDFAKILVITHLEELKDAFPTRIEVEKVDGGSVVKVM
jgi:exonuclease SbcC